jgi:hypothetical protein
MNLLGLIVLSEELLLGTGALQFGFWVVYFSQII